jgi:hypothetical protein
LSLAPADDVEALERARALRPYVVLMRLLGQHLPRGALRGVQAGHRHQRPAAGEVHLNGAIAGFEYIPDNTSLPTYSGTYSEKLNGVLLELTFEDDQERISQFRLRSQLVGTDGSTLRLAMYGQGDAQRTG